MEQPPQTSPKPYNSNQAEDQPEKCNNIKMCAGSNIKDLVSQSSINDICSETSDSSQTMPISDERSLSLCNDLSDTKNEADATNRTYHKHFATNSIQGCPLSMKDLNKLNREKIQDPLNDASSGDYPEKNTRDNSDSSVIADTQESTSDLYTKESAEQDRKRCTDVCSETNPAEISNQKQCSIQNTDSENSFADSALRLSKTVSKDSVSSNSSMITKVNASDEQPSDLIVNSSNSKPDSELKAEATEESAVMCQGGNVINSVKQFLCTETPVTAIADEEHHQFDEESESDEELALMIDEDRESDCGSEASPVKDFSQCEYKELKSNEVMHTSSIPIQTDQTVNDLTTTVEKDLENNVSDKGQSCNDSSTTEAKWSEDNISSTDQSCNDSNITTAKCSEDNNISSIAQSCNDSTITAAKCSEDKNISSTDQSCNDSAITAAKCSEDNNISSINQSCNDSSTTAAKCNEDNSESNMDQSFKDSSATEDKSNEDIVSTVSTEGKSYNGSSTTEVHSNELSMDQSCKDSSTSAEKSIEGSTESSLQKCCNDSTITAAKCNEDSNKSSMDQSDKDYSTTAEQSSEDRDNNGSTMDGSYNDSTTSTGKSNESHIEQSYNDSSTSAEKINEDKSESSLEKYCNDSSTTAAKCNEDNGESSMDQSCKDYSTTAKQTSEDIDNNASTVDESFDSSTSAGKSDKSDENNEWRLEQSCSNSSTSAEKSDEDNSESSIGQSCNNSSTSELFKSTPSEHTTMPAVIPPVKTSSMMTTDSLRLIDLKIKLDKFTEINRTWQKRKPEIITEKSDKRSATPTRTNIFDALSATFSPISTPSTEQNSGESALSGTDATKSQHAKSLNISSQQDVREKETVERDQTRTCESTENQDSSKGSFTDVSANPDESLTDPNAPLSEQGNEIMQVQEELQALNSLLGVQSPNTTSQSSQRKNSEEFEIPKKNSHSVNTDNHTEKSNNDSTSQAVTSTCSSAEKISQDQPISDSSKLRSERVVNDLNSRSDSTVYKSCTNKMLPNTDTTDQQPSKEVLEDDDEQTMKIMEIFTVHASPEKSSRKSEEIPTKESSTPGRQVANESLLDILNRDREDEEPIRRAPQIPAEVNWRDYGVKRCQKCSFTTSDEALLQVHTCKRSSTITPASTIAQNVPSAGFPNSGKSVMQSDTRNHSNTTVGTDANVARKAPVKIKKPPLVPKVWKNTKCRVIRLEKNQYMCTICNHRTNYPLFIGHLVEHMLEYPYTCPYCTSPGTLLFQRSVDITAHINTHKEKSHKFSMFGFSAAKAFLDRVNASGSETLSGIWVDPKGEIAETINTSSSACHTVKSPLQSTATGSTLISPASVGRTPVQANAASPVSVGITPGTLMTPVNTSQTILNAFFPTSAVSPGHRLVSCTPMFPGLSSPPAVFASNPSVVHGVRPLALTQQDIRCSQNQILPTVLHNQQLSSNASVGNPLLVFMPPPATATSAPLIQGTTTLSKEPSAVIMPSVTVSSQAAVGSSANLSFTSSVQGTTTTQSTTPSQAQKPIPETSTAANTSTLRRSPHTPNILRKTKNLKSMTVTVGRVRDKMFCFGCSYKTVSMPEFRDHIWEHLHGEMSGCSHQKGVPAIPGYCPFVEKIITSVPVVASTSAKTASTNSATQSSTADREMTTDAGLVKQETQGKNDAVEDGDSDCEIIADLGKPEPLVIDLTDEPSSSSVQTQHGDCTDGEEGGTELRIQSAYSLNQEGDTVKGPAEPTEDPVRETSLETEQTNRENQEGIILAPSGGKDVTSSRPVHQHVSPSPTDRQDISPSPSDHQHTSTSQTYQHDKRESMFYVCGFGDCWFSCIMSEQFKHHLLINHRGAGEYPCAHCGHKSPGEEELFRHMLSHSSAKMFLLYKCGFPRCRFGTNLISEFQQHNDIFHKNADNFTCASCKAAYPSLNDLCAHFQASLLKFVQCPYCSVKTKDRRTILCHISEMHPGKPRQITVTSQLVCSSISQEKRRPIPEYQRDSSSKTSQNKRVSGDCHAAKQTSNLDMPSQTPSDGCVEQVVSGEEENQSGRENQRAILEPDRFQCHICEMSFETFPLLSDHLSSTHDGFQVVLYNCKQCKFITNNKVQIEDHLEKTHANKGKGFKSSKNMVGVKQLKCQVCPFTTTSGEELEAHFNAHEVVQVQTEIPSSENAIVGKEFRFSCPVCKKNMERYRKLVQHIRRSHSQVKQVMLYRCQICPYLSTALRVILAHYSRKHPGNAKILRLKRHISDSSKSREVATESTQDDFSVHWFHCDHCSYSSGDRKDLLEHLKCHGPSGEGNIVEPDTVKSPKVNEERQNADDLNLPNESIFKSSVKCPHCEYSTKVRVNLYRHMKHHKSDDKGSDNRRWKVPPWKAASPIKGLVKSSPSSPDKGKKVNPSAQKTLSPKMSPPSNSPRREKDDVNPGGSATKTGQEFYKCRLCPFKATDVQSLHGHLSCHKSQSHLKCSYCSLKCTNKVTMIKHLTKEHPDLPRKYDGGSPMSPEKGNIITNKLGPKKGQSPGSSDSPSKKSKLCLPGTKKRQLSGSSGSPTKKPKLSPPSTAAYECVLCGFKSKTINSLEEHFKTSHEVKAFVCSRCKFQTLRLLIMEKHLATEHNQKQMLYKMSETKPTDKPNSASTTPEKGLTSNVSPPSKPKTNQSPSPPKSKIGPISPAAKSSPTVKADECEDGVLSKQNMKCGICSCITGSKSSLIEHSVLKHGKDVEPVMIPVTVHKCVDCGIRFRNKPEAKEHNIGCLKRILKESERTAAAEKNKPISPAKTSSIGNKITNKSDSTECAEEESASDQEAAVPVEIIESSDSQDFEKKKFRCPEVFQYKCPLCPHAGYSRQRMKEHYFVHFKYYPYKCVYCSKVFSRADRIQGHTLKAHPGKVLDSKLRRNEQMELKVEKLLKENRTLVRRSSFTGTKGKSPNKIEGKIVSPNAENTTKDGPEVNAEKTSPPERETTPQPVKREYDPSNPFHCELCDFTTSSKKSLHKHTVKHGPPRLQCHKCDYKHFFPYLMKRHYDRSHPGEEMSFVRIKDNGVDTSKPGAISPVPSTSQKRKAEEPADVDNYSIIADEDSEAKILAHLPLQDLYAKYQDQSNRVSFKCLICTFRAHTSGLIAAHMYKHMPKCFQCGCCSYRAYPSSNVSSHMKRSHEGEPRKFKFFKSQALHEYNQMLAKIGKLPFQMPEPKKRKLSQEKRVVDEESDVTDSESKTNYLKKPAVTGNESNASKSGSGGVNFCCHLCKFKIGDITLFAEHLSLHQAFMKSGSKKETAKCGFCSFSSSNVKEFNDHVSTHVSERPIRCGHCDYSCFAKAHMRSHIRSKHPDDKMMYSESSKEQVFQIRESTPPIDSPGINFDARVDVEDILFLETATFDRLLYSFGITSADLQDLSNDKFNAVIKAY